MLEGFGPMDQTIDWGQRASAARAYLSPVLPRPNLRILSNTAVTRLIVAGMKVQGAHVAGPEFAGEIHADETISCAGAINSPKLLLLSGIGPPDTLAAAGVTVTHALPGVGRNLQDHVDVSLRQYSVAASSMTALLWEPRRTLTGLRWVLRRDGPCATNHFEAAGYIRTCDQLSAPNIQICFIPLLVDSGGRPIGRHHGFQATVMLLQPSSRGSVTLRDGDPASPPRLLFNYLSDAKEIRQLIEGIRATRRIFSQPALRQIGRQELEPGSKAESDRELADFVLRTVKSTHHPCGTCRMGPPNDPDAVVDGLGKVHGLAGLRVVDASLMPCITSGNINAPVLMIAEKIAASITGSVAT
jgi:choline dehydrogenase